MKKITNQRALFELLAIGQIAIGISFLLLEAKVENEVPARQKNVKTEEKFLSKKVLLYKTEKYQLDEEKPTIQADASDIPFEICNEDENWERPSESEQIRQLQILPRYSSELNREPLKSLWQTFWNQNIFSFKSYGLSARQEPIYLSGLWTIIGSIWSCYDANRIAKLNSGESAEVWILLHRVISIKWTGDRYIMVVKPTKKGVQMIQFWRKEHQAHLPLQVITDSGEELKVVQRE
ncbi:MAG: hypothetical protein N3E45_06135 [Oscillatoriaceae bacterium SKW80]|nr:hypothetical protein [Oscillatoriaceae bacterium SKYG93]MCX8120394.1 hypothetical protein [Oscillatoriaceae bacterium SKW80]MDW8453320.1 hypothetical protein [Oscillatoriaceae cyanobacterium SKYGB_i_bin93]HIK27238.1 hypothetical protein [Oscillatoriaceae cyanobacterium M7585_C2015_266]